MSPDPVAAPSAEPDPALLTQLREAAEKVTAADRAWHNAIRARDRLILQAYFRGGLRVYQIATAGQISAATVQNAIRHERARLAEETQDADPPQA